MKKKFLTFMLFFAFLVMGVQNVSAQSYVSESEAMVLVQTEIQTIEAGSVDPITQEKTAYYAANVAKLEFLKSVNLHLLDGETTADAIIHGVHDAAVADYVAAPVNDIGEVTYRAPLHQEVVDLLSL